MGCLPAYVRDRPGDAVAWGWRDADTDLMPTYTNEGLWFTMDLRTSRSYAPGEEVCYFIGPKQGTHIKIGKSVDVRKRLRTLQLSSPTRLSILALTCGGGAVEAEYHRRFADDRAWGEWFFRSKAIEREIRRLLKPISEAEIERLSA
jgi:hypothetical protein